MLARTIRAVAAAAVFMFERLGIDKWKKWDDVGMKLRLNDRKFQRTIMQCWKRGDREEKEILNISNEMDKTTRVFIES